jgi:hypothetical protein
MNAKAKKTIAVLLAGVLAVLVALAPAPAQAASKKTISTSTKIMGTPTISQKQATRYIKNLYKKKGWKLPSKWRKDKVTLAKLVKWFYAEAKAEGVRGDVAFAQSLYETGFFRFGNLVSSSQYNFAGLGATGPGHPGYSFKTAKLGIRAQVQHLKAYASTKSLKNKCIDVRFNLVARGCATTIGALGGKWAVPGIGYGAGIALIMTRMANA